MALDSYAGLQAAVGNEVNRADLTGVIPDLITRFEARARRELRDWLTSNLLLTNIAGDTVLASTVQEVLSVNYNDGASGAHNFPLDLVSREQYQNLLEQQSAVVNPPGQVCYVDVDQDANTITLRFWPPLGTIANLRVAIVKVLPALSVTQTTNALLRDAPDLYLFGSCAEAAKYLQHDERVSLWVSERDQGFKGLRILAERRKYGGVPRPRAAARVF